MTGHKRSMNEGGIRVPMVVRWPGRIAAGRESDLPWYFPDVMPTLAELAGVPAEVPEGIDGISVAPTLLDRGEQKKHEYLFWESRDRAVRMGKWKGILRRGKVGLYDLTTDIGEKTDLAEKHPDIAEKLGRYMQEAWRDPRSQKDDGKYTGKPPRAKKNKKKR